MAFMFWFAGIIVFPADADLHRNQLERL